MNNSYKQLWFFCRSTVTKMSEWINKQITNKEPNSNFLIACLQPQTWISFLLCSQLHFANVQWTFNKPMGWCPKFFYKSQMCMYTRYMYIRANCSWITILLRTWYCLSFIPHHKLTFKLSLKFDISLDGRTSEGQRWQNNKALLDGMQMLGSQESSLAGN